MHKFSLGQSVEYRPSGQVVKAFTVTKRMPLEHNSAELRYRIKSASEGFERSVAEYDLTAAERDAA